jgi:hypothetical protein
MYERVPLLLQKLNVYKPRFVCFIGKGMCANVEKILKRELNQKGRLAPSSRDKLQKLKTEIGWRPFKLVRENPGDSLLHSFFRFEGSELTALS